MLDGIPQIYGATAFTAAFRQFSRTSPRDFTWEIIPSHFEIDRGPIEKTAIFRRLKAERCNCRFRSPMILFVSLVNLCLHWLNFWPARISGRQIERMISFDRIPILKFVRSLIVSWFESLDFVNGFFKRWFIMLRLWKGNEIVKDCIFEKFEIDWSDLLLFDNRLLILNSGLITFSIFYERNKIEIINGYLCNMKSQCYC